MEDAAFKIFSILFWMGIGALFIRSFWSWLFAALVIIVFYVPLHNMTDKFWTYLEKEYHISKAVKKINPDLKEKKD